MPTLRPTAKNHVEIERSFVQCGPSSKQQNSLKCSPLENWNLLLLHGSSNASTGGTHLKEKGLRISAHLEVANFSASNGWIGRFMRRHNIAYRIL
jgi:hypothetical protein